jgi:hypothetical protein
VCHCDERYIKMRTFIIERYLKQLLWKKVEVMKDSCHIIDWFKAFIYDMISWRYNSSSISTYLIAMHKFKFMS